MYPENHMVKNALHDGIKYGKEHADEIAILSDISDLQFNEFSSAKPTLLKHLKSSNPNERYWALINCTTFQQKDKELISEARTLLNDKDNMVANRAAEFLGILQEKDVLPTMYRIINETNSTQEQMIALNTLVYLKDFKGYTVDLKQLKTNGIGEAKRRLEYLRSNL